MVSFNKNQYFKYIDIEDKTATILAWSWMFKSSV